MNKLILTIAISLSFVYSAFALNVEPKPIHVKKATFYAEECVKEFGIDDATKTKLIDLKAEQIAESATYYTKKRKGEMTAEEVKAKMKELNKKYGPQFRKLIGFKDHKKFQAFNKRVSKEMNQIKPGKKKKS